ncbi:MAG: ATP-binding protein [Deltaproteobacteria bacterium]|nr:ATP-binding protein [Deltaproteobacteria bacterium]
MYDRLIAVDRRKSFFLFGPRGTGKSWWVQHAFPDAAYIDLLEAELYNELLAQPGRLEKLAPATGSSWVIIDEIQKVPALLDEVHRLIEGRGLKFVLTGSSARKLRRRGVNLLAGRALTCALHPLTARELGQDFDLDRSLRFGHLPCACTEHDPARYLASYVRTYLREEVLQEGLTRNLAAFGRFLEAASFAQAGVLSVAAVAREAAVERRVVQGYFEIAEDLLLGVRLPAFTKRAKRRVVGHPKFFYFDVGVYRAVRPRGPLDRPEEIEGASLETLVFQELRALNDYLGLGYTLFYWRSATGLEVDFVAYGERGIRAFEVKRAGRLRPEDFQGLRAFLDDYPMAQAQMLYGGDRPYHEGPISVVPIEEALRELDCLL